VTVIKEGQVAVVGSVLTGLLQSMPSGATITLTLVDGLLAVEGANSVSKVAIQDVAEFPELPRAHMEDGIVLPAKKLKEALSSVSFCTSTSTIKPELAAVFTYFDGNDLVNAATDSFRLAEKRAFVYHNCPRFCVNYTPCTGLVSGLHTNHP
jgi:DNA polymerase III sliding clamp (beta) subunit (PCNA family)